MSDKQGLLHLIEEEEVLEDVELIWADSAYRGEELENTTASLGISLEVISRQSTGFKVLPRRWVVERTFAWLSQYRRFSKDYEENPKSSKSMIYMAMLKMMLKRAAKLIF